MKIGTLLALLDDKTRLGSLILLLFCGAFLLLSLTVWALRSLRPMASPS